MFSITWVYRLSHKEIVQLYAIEFGWVELSKSILSWTIFYECHLFEVSCETGGLTILCKPLWQWFLLLWWGHWSGVRAAMTCQTRLKVVNKRIQVLPWNFCTIIEDKGKILTPQFHFRSVKRNQMINYSWGGLWSNICGVNSPNWNHGLI